MRELTCRACGRNIRAGLAFCSYCGSKDIVAQALNNAYSYNNPAVNNPNSASYAAYNNRYPKNPKNNVYACNNNYSNYSTTPQSNSLNSSPEDFDRRMSRLQQNIRNKSMEKMNRSRAQYNNVSIQSKYGDSSYTQYENNSSSTSTSSKSSNPYIANKDFYTHNQQNSISGYQSVFDNDESVEEKKSMSSITKGIIAFGAVLAVGLAVLFFTGTLDPIISKIIPSSSTSMADGKNNTDNKPVLTGSADVEFSAGKLDGNTYTNPWSNMIINIPDGYTNKDEEGYKQYNTEYMTCGLYAENEKGESIVNLYIDLAKDDGSFSEKAYLDESKDDFESYGMTIDSASDYEEVTVCGKKYLATHISAKSGTVSFTQSIYVRQDGDKACVILITTTDADAEGNKAIVDSFKPYA